MSEKEQKTEEKSASSHAPNFKVKDRDEDEKEPLLTRKNSDKQKGRKDNKSNWGSDVDIVFVLYLHQRCVYFIFILLLCLLLYYIYILV